MTWARGSVLIGVCLLANATALAADITGPARVIDGDTIVIAGEHIRLYGIDAPEIQQLCEKLGTRWPCGAAATRAIARKISEHDVTCQPKGHDRHWRVLAVCFVDGDDVNAWMVREGWAFAYRRYSMDYVDAEEEAKTARRGLWSSEFQMPWDFRRKQ